MKRSRRNCGLTLFGCVFTAVIACHPAQAQGTFTAPYQVGQGNQASQTPVFNLPPGVSKLVSIDAQNVLLAELTNGQYQLLAVQHVYSGGIARLFGGAVIPTAAFVSPAFNTNAAAAGNNNNVSTNNVSTIGGNANSGGVPFGVNGF